MGPFADDFVPTKRKRRASDHILVDVGTLSQSRQKWGIPFFFSGISRDNIFALKTKCGERCVDYAVLIEMKCRNRPRYQKPCPSLTLNEFSKDSLEKGWREGGRRLFTFMHVPRKYIILWKGGTVGGVWRTAIELDGADCPKRFVMVQLFGQRGCWEWYRNLRARGEESGESVTNRTEIDLKWRVGASRLR